jgi:TonB family protein
MKSKSGFTLNLAIVAVFHGVLIAALIFFPSIPGCEQEHERPIVPVDLVVEVPPGDESGEETSPDKWIPPDPEPEAESSAPEPEPEAMPLTSSKLSPKPPPKNQAQSQKKTTTVAAPKTGANASSKTSKGKIQVSRKKVKNPYGSSKSTRMPTKLLSAAEIRKRLAAGSQIGDHTSEVDDNYLYLEIVRRTFYQAWTQPSSIPIDGMAVKVDIELGLNGAVLDSRLASSSGNSVMDESVLRAVKAVRRIPGLSAEFIRQHRRMPVVFELTGER